MIKNTPNMTSYTTPSGVVTASTEFSSYYAGWHAFDGLSNLTGDARGVPRGWLTTAGATTGFLVYQFPTVQAVKWYSITAREIGLTGESPNTWNFYGSNDLVNWDLLDARAGETGWTPSEKRTYTISVTPKFYLNYYLDVTTNDGSLSYLAINQFCMYNDDTIQKTQMDDIRAKIASERSRRSLSAPTWTDPVIIEHETKITKENIDEIRSNLTTISGAATWSEDATVDRLITKIKQLHLDDVEKLVDGLAAYSADMGTPQRAGCVAACTGLCSNSCATACSVCTGNCYGSCGQGCTSYCEAGCSTTCYGSCGLYCGTDCTGTCGQNATGCGSTCFSGCGNNCGSGCSDGCLDNCWQSCYMSCGSDCTHSCTAACNRSCGGGCEAHCSTSCTGTCDDNCNQKCGWNCYPMCFNNCQQSCKGCTGCQSSCGGACAGCYSGCSGGCDAGCSNSCFTVCIGSCSATCKNECVNSNSIGGF